MWTGERSESLKVDREVRTLRGLALEKLRDAIVGLHFKPGDRLVERTLGEQLGVSRTVVREVLRHLEAEGLVEMVPHHGPIVARLDPATAVQIYELRAILEGAAARACAEHASDNDLVKLTEALEHIRRGYEAHNVRAILDATSSFYEVMFRSGGKTVAWDIVQMLNARMTHLRAMTISSVGRSTTGPAQLDEILNALRSRDADKAEAACLVHVQEAGRIALKVLRGETLLDESMIPANNPEKQGSTASG